MKYEFNTKLRLENSMLGTYKLEYVEGAERRIVIPKGLNVEAFIGLCLKIEDLDTGELDVVMVTGATVFDNDEKTTVLAANRDSVAVYYPSTGELELQF